MIDFLKKYNKKTIDVYELAFEYCKKPFLQWSQDEIKDFINQLQIMDDQKIIELKRGSKGEAKLDSILRKISDLSTISVIRLCDLPSIAFSTPISRIL